jgi:uncharacterized metal-binding protein YceD (DUF177 family)
MTKKENYTIPYVGLKNEKHTFHYQLNVEVIFDKSITPYILDFEISGTIESECDRCASIIDVPFTSKNRVYVKFDTHADEIVDEDLEILYLHPDDSQIDIETYLYDFTLLSIPYSKVCKDAGQKCDPEVIKHLENSLQEQEKQENTPDPRWEGLNKLKD